MKGIFLYPFALVMLCMTGCNIRQSATCTLLDITGNWHDSIGFSPFLQTDEPALKDGEEKLFIQDLVLPGGSYRILFEYDQYSDVLKGGTFANNEKIFDGFTADGISKRLVFRPVPDTSGRIRYYRAECEFMAVSGKPVRLATRIRNTRMMRSWISAASLPLSGSGYYAADPGITDGEYLLIRGIPFLARRVDIRHDLPWFSVNEPSLSSDRGSLKRWDGGMHFDLSDTKINTVHFLGMIHQADIANGSWFCLRTDQGYSHFLGDRAGDIIITLADNTRINVPLIFGFNMWYSRPWDFFWYYNLSEPDPGVTCYNYDSTIFCGEKSYRDLIRSSVSLSDGMRLMGSGSNNTRFIFSLALNGKPVRSIEVRGNEEMHGHPLISAITVAAAGPVKGLSPLPCVSSDSSSIRPVDTGFINESGYLPALDKLKHILYTYRDELPQLEDPVIPDNYFGPRYDFRGTRAAVYAATYLYRNGPECGSKIADQGNLCASSIAEKQLLYYTFGTGIWRHMPSYYGNLDNWFSKYRAGSPGNFPGAGSAWSRGIGELMREAMAFGYGKYINSYTDWLDSCLFSEANPPHWTRIVGSGNRFEGSATRKIGDITETGNRENDGHGICMWGRYLVWHWLGEPDWWNEKHWEATRAAVNWVRWQLDTDTIFPGQRKDILYTESECGNYEFYASYNCLHGIDLSIRMAEALGKSEEAVSWRRLYRRLEKGILDNLVEQSEYGPVWHTDPENNWRDDGQKMVHIQLAPDGFTYTPLQDYAHADSATRRFLEIDINSYRYLMKDKNYYFLRSYGYGQGMMTQAALLLDEMEDAGHLVDMMVDHCYLPRLEGWTAPEGIVVHSSGDYWVAVNGYLGQDSHLADSQKALRLMLGIDDNDAAHLRIIPRYPAAWDHMAVSGFPVLAGDRRHKISYCYDRKADSQIFTYNLDRSADDLDLRLGPVPGESEVTMVTFNGRKVNFELQESGDSRWVWLRGLPGSSGKAVIQLGPRAGA